ncbi:hypothetical protein GGX14DRAFT_404523 [Mycena pura]|uniref:Uncharacterized protein n=1 Tax=Mycena pura TaxID=153505 RepID=A0AAD6UU63_9AGAR|nr:hypothetical protein GGX14DRAFT_404523 [Mycena pura]
MTLSQKSNTVAVRHDACRKISASGLLSASQLFFIPSPPHINRLLWTMPSSSASQLPTFQAAASRSAGRHHYPDERLQWGRYAAARHLAPADTSLGDIAIHVSSSGASAYAAPAKNDQNGSASTRSGLQFLVFPYMYNVPHLGPFEAAVHLLNPVCVVLVWSASITAAVGKNLWLYSAIIMASVKNPWTLVRSFSLEWSVGHNLKRLGAAGSCSAFRHGRAHPFTHSIDLDCITCIMQRLADLPAQRTTAPPSSHFARHLINSSNPTRMLRQCCNLARHINAAAHLRDISNIILHFMFMINSSN